MTCAVLLARTRSFCSRRPFSQRASTRKSSALMAFSSIFWSVSFPSSSSSFPFFFRQKRQRGEPLCHFRSHCTSPTDTQGSGSTCQHPTMLTFVPPVSATKMSLMSATCARCVFQVSSSSGCFQHNSPKLFFLSPRRKKE